ncbi:MAG: helix-turn-helix transcriptional regulator [Gelidibacter sp.]|nr:helix-turn-helix transcriptional regulator [Gelidibacter sp.]
MGNTNTNWVAMSDSAIVVAIGKYIKEQRLLQNKTQLNLATEAGVNRWTISQIENGEAITLLSLIQILRALDQLHVLDAFKIEQQISPIELAKLAQQKRQRASSKADSEHSDTNW